MPTCGKSTLGKMISEKYGYEFIDTDELIENKINGKISDFIKLNGEEKFRDIESEVIKEVSSKNHVVISTGGGAILRNENVANLKHNGKLFFINRSLELLKPTSDRPLTSNVDDLKKKYDERLPIYKNTCDVEIDGDVEYDVRIDKILKNH
ncbi:MAG: shikimate kinase [Lachnospiraceae bacterium]|nr:shikimate kinase [Lachnospiraceae bacterium]